MVLFFLENAAFYVSRERIKLVYYDYAHYLAWYFHFVWIYSKISRNRKSNITKSCGCLHSLSISLCLFLVVLFSCQRVCGLMWYSEVDVWMGCNKKQDREAHKKNCPIWKKKNCALVFCGERMLCSFHFHKQ